MRSTDLTRRDFLHLSSTIALGAGLCGAPPARAAEAKVAIVVSPDDRLASSAPVAWAIGELRRALTARGLVAAVIHDDEQARGADLVVVVADGRGAVAKRWPGIEAAGALGREALALLPDLRRPRWLACGADVRGLMYAVLELADRVDYADEVLHALGAGAPTREAPLNAVRAVGRVFVSDVEDKGWFGDREFWPAYLGMLARQRVNRFHLGLGFGYDTLSGVTDAYLLFPYPFLLAVPGYDVRASGLADSERERNLESLRFISREAAARGIDFQLGIWTHGYTWAASPRANHTIEGLTPANHGAYCRDALAGVLRACPDIAGVTLRTHYESGVREGSYAFWRTIFEGVPRSGRTVEIELHAKGLDKTMVEAALATGMPVRLSAKYWAEHTGLPYHQAAIRSLELPHADVAGSFSALSLGSRNHTRYGYADFLEESRPYGVMYRVFPGTHKFLLWGDPVSAAAHARAFQFCGSDGAELLEPLAFKGRRGSGLAGGRCAYADGALAPEPDWRKYLYTYTLWGRLLYNPDTAPETWRRLLRKQYRSAATDVESALGSATRILPIITAAHLPSAAQDTYSPEFYVNHSIPDADAPAPYGDTPAPKMFGTVSPLDPEMFSGVDEWVGQLLDGQPNGKYSPAEVARWIDDLADSAAAGLARAEGSAPASRGVELLRAAADIRVQVGIGRFFAAKLRAGALYGIYRASGSADALREAVRQYRQARDAWERFAREAGSVYARDITFGPLPHQRGHWLDRLAAIDADIASMERRLTRPGGPDPASALQPASAVPASRVRAAMASVLEPARRRAPRCEHHAPDGFVPGRPLRLLLAVREPASSRLVCVHYRHVNQAERYQAAEMRLQGGVFEAEVPARYTDSRFPLQYYFELRDAGGGASLFPGFNEELTNQPYYVVRHRKKR